MSSILTSAITGLSNTYSILSQQYPNGITLDNLKESFGNKTLSSSVNTNFLSYLMTNFKNLDKDSDGIINSNDLNQAINSMSTQGLTYNEILQLSNSGTNNSLLNTVLNYFNEIDSNGDGKVTQSEIQAFKHKAQEAKLRSEYDSFKPSSMSIFYVDSDDDKSKSPSILDARYPEDISML